METKTESVSDLFLSGGQKTWMDDTVTLCLLDV